MARRLVATVVGAALGVALIAAPAAAGTTTKMTFSLDSIEVPAGSMLTGSVQLWWRNRTTWTPLAGAEVSVMVDGIQVGTLTTDASGGASVSWPAAVTAGTHVMKVVFAGTTWHARSQRARGFQVTDALPVTGTVPEAPFIWDGSGGSGFVHLGWIVPADGGSPITGYNVYRGTTFGAETLYASVPGTQTDFTDFAVVSAQPYFYFVTAVNAVGESPHSNVFMVTPG